jgi:hypothetical protein
MSGMLPELDRLTSRYAHSFSVPLPAAGNRSNVASDTIRRYGFGRVARRGPPPRRGSALIPCRSAAINPSWGMPLKLMGTFSRVPPNASTFCQFPYR